MAKVSQMQGVSAHIEKLKKAKEDLRRNIAYCQHSKHILKRIYICQCKSSGYHNQECHSSSWCDFYVDNRL